MVLLAYLKWLGHKHIEYCDVYLVN